MPHTSTAFRLAAAEAFVLANGTPRQRAYWKAAFGWGPVEVWLFEVEQFQGPEGGWGNGLTPADGGRPDTIVGTAEALHWLGWLNLGEDVFEVLPRTLKFLEARQQPDGSWGDVGETVAIAATLAFMDELPDAVEAAARHVAPLPLATLPAARRALALALLRGRPGSEVVADTLYQSLQQDLEGAGTVTLAAIHEGLIQAGLPPADPLRAGVLDRLADRQLPDGSFQPDGADPVDATFFASRALVTR